MKRYSILFLVLGLFGFTYAQNVTICNGQSAVLTASSQPSGTPCTIANLPAGLVTGLQAFYPFCGNANDISSNGRNGTVNGATLTTDRFGNANSAYNFTTNQSITVPSSATLNTYPLTISLWYNCSSLAANQNGNLFSKYVPASWNGFGLMINDEGVMKATEPFYLISTTRKLIGHYGEPDFHQPNVNLNTWYHLVFTADNSGGKLYVNGNLVSTDTWTGLPGASTNSFLWKIGGMWDFWFNGKIDDVGIWNRVITASEVTQLYNLGQAPSYSWSNGANTQSITVSPSSTTAYTCTVNQNGINNIQTFNVIVNPTPSMTSPNSTTICSGSTLNFQLTASGTSTFTWQATANANVTGEATTVSSGSVINNTLVNTTSVPQIVTYTVIPTSTSGCIGTPQTVSITVNPSPSMTSPSSSTICSGLQLNIPLTATTPSSFLWQATANANVTGETTSSTSSGIINNILINTTSTPQTVVYTVIPSSSFGCTGAPQTILVTVNPTPVITSPNSSVICSGSTLNIVLSASSASTFNWQAASNANVTGETTTITTGGLINNTLVNTSTIPQTVVYTIIPTSNFGCIGTPQTLLVTVNPSPTVNAGPDQSVCAGGQVLLSATGANSYSWSNGVVNNVPFIPSNTTLYTVIGVGSNGCTSSDQVLVTVLPLPPIFAGPDQTICNGSSVTLTATGGFSYIWNNGVTNGVPFTPSPGVNSYTVIGTGSNGCTNSDVVVITVNASGVLNAGPDITICPGDSVTLYVPIDSTLITNVTATSGTYIADFSSQPYGNSIQVSGLPAGSTITSAGDLSQICLDIEHSFLGDLDIWLQCPNGQIAPLVNAYTQGNGGFLPGGVSGGSVFLGDPIDDVTGPPGTGWQYCFSSTNNTVGLMTSNVFNTIQLSTTTGNNSNGFSMNPNPVYYPEAPFSNLIGCPVNGTWTIFIQDEWQVDDGYLFSWSMDLASSVNPGAVISAQWSNGVSNGVPFVPTSSGTYTVTGVTASGCIVTDQVNVTILPASSCISGGGFVDQQTFLPFSQDNFIPTVIDYNNDGIDDVYGFISHQTNTNKLWLNNGNLTFTDVSSSTNFPIRNGGRVIDLDKNGLSDIFYISGDSVLVNYNINGIYQPAVGSCAAFSISSLFGISIPSIRQVQFADYNNDGVYDLLVQVQNGNQSQLRAISGQVGCQAGCPFVLNGTIQSLLTVNTLNYVETKFADLDNDFDMDILLSFAVNQYQNATYQTYRNNGSGTFTQLLGTGYQIGRSNAFGTVGEINNDGIPDIISGAADCCVQGDPLYLHLSNGVFNYNVSTSAIPRFLDPYYGKASLVDLNLDTKKDIVWVGLAAIGSAALQYHVNNGNGTFTESASAYNIDEGPLTGQCCPIKNSMHAVVIDLNNDKKPDLDIRELDFYTPYTFVNNWTKINNSSLKSVKLKLQACVGLREGWGAQLSYKTGGQWYHQQHTANTQDDYPFLYLGMGNNLVIDSLIIKWVGGNVTTMTNIASNQYISISETNFCAFGQTLAQVIPNTTQVICTNQNTQLVADVQNINTIQWFLNGQSINGANSISLTTNLPGYYSFIANNGSICNVASDSVLVQTLQAPNVLIDPISNDTLCNTECAILVASGAQDYDWFDGTTLYYNEVYSTGNYYVVGTNANGCQDTATVQMTIYPANDTTIYIAAMNSYTLNGVTYTNSGVYEQVLMNQYGCDSTITLDLDLSFAGIEETGNSISIYPNPAADNLFIHSSFEINSSFEISDASGRVVLRDRIESNQFKIDVSSLAPGCYIIKINELQSRFDFVKQ